MSCELVIDVKADEIIIALLREKKLVELTKEKTSMQFAVGDMYLGKVKKIMPGLNAAFVNVGYEKDAFLHYLDLSPQFHTVDAYIKQCIARKGMPVSKMKLEDSFIPLIVPSIAVPVTFFYMKQYMESSLPLSLIEAARIDGSGEFRTFNAIVLPLMKPAIAVQAIFTFVSSWNNYFTPALILHDDKKKTLPILIAQLRGADWLKFDMGQVYVMIAFSIFPVIVVYLILSKHIVQGVALGSVKG